jgi:threonine/homoserine efflux transporter RhtA
MIGGSPITARSRLDGCTPRVGVRARLAGAAIAWTVGTTILLVRGIYYLYDEHWAWQLVTIAIALGVLKSRIVLDRVARRAVTRISERSSVCFFGFFPARAWLLVALMIGGGVVLRRAGINHGIAAIIHIGVGTALLVANRIFWRALLARSPQPPTR